MEPELQGLTDFAFDLWAAVKQQGRLLLLPSRLLQFAIIVGGFVLAWGLKLRYAPRLHAWMRTLEGWPKWRLRLLVLFHRYLQLILFMVLMWIAAAVLAEVFQFPSRRYLVRLAASLATAWLLVSLATRLIQNRLLRRTVTWGLWVYVTLYYFDLIEPVSDALDQAAIKFGEIRVSLLLVVQALVVATLLLVAVRFLSRTTSARIRENPDLSPSMQVLAIKAAQVILYGAAFFILVKAIGFDLTGLAVLSGAIGVGLGFGLQKVVSNLVSGVIILLDKSIKPGDVISIGNTFGWINSLSARYVSISTRDGREYLIPNEDLITGQVLNWSHSDDFVRLDVDFGMSYDEDPHVVRKVAVDAAASVPRVLSAKPPVCHIVAFGESSVDYVLRFWITDPTDGLTNIRGNVFLALWDAFKEHELSIPFPQREVRLLGESRGDLETGTEPAME